MKFLFAVTLLVVSHLSHASNTQTGEVRISMVKHWLGAGTVFIHTVENEINASSNCPNSGKYIIPPDNLEVALSMLLSAQASGKIVEMTIGANCYSDWPQIVAVRVKT